MCGIAGCYQQADGHKLTDIMTDRIAHRGPDASGVWSHQDDRVSVQLGHLRLSIIDLSAAADQPLSKGGLTIVYNGELYNYREVRKELASHGVSFVTSSDTEVVLEAWRYWGPAALSRFRGMFAFALADTHTGELFLARDPLGIKPLFYLQRGDGRAVRLRAEGADRRGRTGAARRAGRAGRVDALLLGARAVLRHRGRPQAPGRLLGPPAPGRRPARRAVLERRRRGQRSGRRPRARPGPGHRGVGRRPPGRRRAGVQLPVRRPGLQHRHRARAPPPRRSTPTRSPSGPRTSGWRPCPTTRSTPARSRRSSA